MVMTMMLRMTMIRYQDNEGDDVHQSLQALTEGTCGN